MTERKYSVSEIDRMRKALGVIFRWLSGGAETEEVLRTYMLNGTEPEELEAEATPILAKREAVKSGVAVVVQHHAVAKEIANG